MIDQVQCPFGLDEMSHLELFSTRGVAIDFSLRRHYDRPSSVSLCPAEASRLSIRLFASETM